MSQIDLSGIWKSCTDTRENLEGLGTSLTQNGAGRKQFTESPAALRQRDDCTFKPYELVLEI